MSTAPKKAKFCDLTVNRNLLDSKFEGYKLFLEQLRTEIRQLPSSVKTITPSIDQWSYQHLRLISSHNHIHVDPWTIGQTQRNVYIVLSSGIYGFQVEKGKFVLTDPRKLFELSFPSDISARSDKFNVSLTFPSPDLVIVADGVGSLILCSTVDGSWRAGHSFEKLCDDHAFVILDSRSRKSGSDHCIDILIAYVEETGHEKSAGDESGVFSSILEWITLNKGTSETAYLVGRRRRLKTKGNLDYAALSTDCKAICCLTSEPIRFIYDSEKTVDDAEVEESREDTSKQYSWGQTIDHLCVVFTLNPHISKNDIVWRLESENIFVALDQKPEAQRVLLEGELHLPVDVEGSTWTLDEGRLEIILSKKDEGRMWPEVVNGDQRGEYVPDPDLVREVSERLKQFTSDAENPSAVEAMTKAPFNVQQLEECDAVDADGSYLWWIDGETHSQIIEADTGGHQWLFNIRLNAEHLPYICLRHDVDGILWRVADSPAIESDQPSYWTHEYTFNAFGYVQAGKRDRKFCICSTDCSYAVVVDCTRHAYIYWQPTSVDSDLRNRKTGQRVSKVAKQQLITINPGASEAGNDEASMDVLGVAAFDDVLLLLTENRLMAVFVK